MACPRQPDLFAAFPRMITSEELYTPEQLAELREQSIPFYTFRENLLLNENMQPFVMNLILYSTYFYEVSMVVTSFLAWTLPCFLFIGLLITRKPDFVRALIVYLTAKICFMLFNERTSYYFKNEKFYICPVFSSTDGSGTSLTENMGFCEQSFLVSMFFTYLVLSTLMSMNNFLCSSIIQRMNFSFYAMIAGASFLFALYLSKLHLQ